MTSLGKLTAGRKLLLIWNAIMLPILTIVLVFSWRDMIASFGILPLVAIPVLAIGSFAYAWMLTAPGAPWENPLG